MLFRPVVELRLADRLEVIPHMRAGQRPEGDRRVEGAEGRRADLARRDASDLGEDPDRIDVRELALIGRHAIGRIAFGKLDMAVALVHGELEVLEMHVVLEIDEGLALDAGDRPERL